MLNDLRFALRSLQRPPLLARKPACATPDPRPARALVVLQVGAVLTAFACASAPIKPDGGDVLARADGLMLDGCYDCLLEARGLYQELAAGRARPLVLSRLFETNILLALREKELAIPPDSSLARAAALARELPPSLGAQYDAWLRYLVDRYTQTRERSYVEKADEIASRLLRRDSRHRGAKLMKAIAEFSLRRDVAAARTLVSQARVTGDTTWLYSLAFLDAYKGDMDLAEEEYERTFRRPPDDVTVPVQCEEFIAGVLEEEPNRVQLHYCSGLINHRAKGDAEATIRDMQAFLESPTSRQFPQQRARAEEILRECLAGRSSEPPRPRDPRRL